jgi:hypothetical protein
LRKELVRENAKVFADELVAKMTQANTALPPLGSGNSPSVVHP